MSKIPYQILLSTSSDVERFGISSIQESATHYTLYENNGDWMITKSESETYLGVRQQLMGTLAPIGFVGAAVFLILGGAGFISTAIFPWDGLCVLAGSVISTFIMRRGYTKQATASFIVFVMWAVAFNVPYYGVNHPITALYLPCIVISGLLAGRSSQGLILTLCGLFIPVWAWFELTGRNRPPVAVRTWEELVNTIMFWWATFGLTSGLVALFARELEQQAMKAETQADVLAKTVNALTKETNTETFLQQVVVAAAEQAQADYCVLLTKRDEHLATRLLYTRSLDTKMLASPVQPAEIPASSSALWASLMKMRKPLLVERVETDPVIPDKLRVASRSILALPLLHQTGLEGVLLIGIFQRRRFTAGEIQVAEALAQQIVLAFALGRLSASTRDSAIIHERTRMAREMHDTLAQGFTGIAVQLEAAQDALENEPEAAHEHLEKARALASESLAEARRSVWALRPLSLEQHPLPNALQSMAERLSTEMRSAIGVVIEGEGRMLPANVETNMLRIAQEAVTNALKHSGASAIHIELRFESNCVVLSVQDNGQGFEPGDADGMGLGLKSLKERAELIAGTLTIESLPMQGTRLSVRWCHE